MAVWNSFSYICTGVLHSFTHCRAERPQSFLCCTPPPSQHRFSLTSVYLVPAIHLLPPSTHFWPYGNHPFFPHAQTIPILSDPHYSLTPFLFPVLLRTSLFPTNLTIIIFVTCFIKDIVMVSFWQATFQLCSFAEKWSTIKYGHKK